MRRGVIAAALLLAPAVAAADEYEYEQPAPEIGEAPGEDVGERELGASLGAAVGGGVTPGGLRVGGDYLYQLSDLDWFDGMVAFTFGGGGAACFRDRANDTICDHGAAKGYGVGLGGGIRRFFGGQQGFRPWVRPAAGLRLSHFADDDLTGVGLFVSAAAGVRVRVAETIAVGGGAALELGGGIFNHDLGPAVQAGLSIAVTVEFALE